MAPSNRRKKAAAAANHSAPSDIPVEADVGKDAAQEEDLKCPGCTENDGNDENKDTWICCDACKTWYHWGTCAGINAAANSGDSITLEQVDKW
jgi:F-box and leucine-rich repeat protein 10/11